VDIHDIALDARQRPVFVNTLFSCIAAPSESHSFRPVWRPPWITRLAAEDRCHPNGLAMRDGAPASVTAVSTTEVHEGWREHRSDGGRVCDVASNDIVVRELYDAAVLGGAIRPGAPGFKTDEIRRTITIGE
jgi:uncharacterized protein (TIGR03032 family)